MRIRLQQVVVDSREPSRLVRFWSALLGGEPVDRPDGWAYVQPPGFPALTFQLVPETKAGKTGCTSTWRSILWIFPPPSPGRPSSARRRSVAS